MRSLVISLVVLGSVSLGGCAKDQAVEPGVSTASTTQTGDRSVERAALVTGTAVVEAVDVKNRLLTLKVPEGRSMTISVDEQVKNLPQIKVGDQVTATYYEALAVEVVPPGTAVPGAAVAEGEARAKPGEKPAGAKAQMVSVIATVEDINRERGTITLKGPQGNSVTVRAQEPKNLEKVKVGDLLKITYTEALAISVEGAPSR